MGLFDLFTPNNDQGPGAVETGITDVLSYLRNVSGPSESLKSAGKTLGGLGARGLEAIVGQPANIANILTDIKDIAGSGISGLLGGVPFVGEQLQKASEFLGEDIEATGRAKLTPEFFREKVTKKLTGEALEPTSGLEGMAQDLVSDVASYISLGGGLKAAAKGSLLKSVLQNSTKALGFSEGAQTAAGMAGMVMGSSTGITNKLKSGVNNAYNVLKRKTPKVLASIKPATKGSLKIISDELGAGLEKTPAKNFLRKTVKDFSKNIKNNKVNLKDLVQAEKDLNDIGFTRELKGSKKLIRSLKRDVSESIKNYGKTNPDFFDAYNNAKGLFKASIAKSYIHDNIVNSKLKGLIKNPVTWFLAGQGKTGIALYGAGHIEKIAKRLLADKGVARLYSSMLKNAANESKGALIKNLKALDNKVNKVLPKFTIPKGFEDAGIADVKVSKEKNINTGKGFSLPAGFELVA